MDKPLSEFVHDVVIDSKKSDLLSAMVGKSRNTLLNELNPENLSNKAGMDLLLPVMEKCDPEDRIMHGLAGARGGVFLRLPEMKGADGARRQFMQAMGELGALARSYEHATSEDGPGGAAVRMDELEKFEAQAQAALTGLQGAIVACRAELRLTKE
nr:phage regulatory CII family protein [uncultured Pseudodesulfovibrio sp.]